jgi:hypothetical protein
LPALGRPTMATKPDLNGSLKMFGPFLRVERRPQGRGKG